MSISLCVVLVALAGTCGAEPRAVEDYTSMWWADGFPSVVPDAPWHRVIQTGNYGFVLGTDAMTVPHFGAVSAGTSYARCGERRAWETLPGAELSLEIAVNGKQYRCVGGGEWGRHAGPRLIESGRFFQRADVTGLKFETVGGEVLNTLARFETAAWPDRLGFVFSATPGPAPITAGENSFGRVGGGYGLDGTNAFEIPHSPGLDPEKFTLDFWAYVPSDYRASERVWPWLVCKNRNEMADGNFGILLVDGKAQVRMNIGGGKKGAVVVRGRKQIRLDAWNRFVMSYDGERLRFFLNGRADGEQLIARKRKPGRHALVFGRREDGHGDGHHFRGVVDEVRLFDRALTVEELKAAEPVRRWSFLQDGVAARERPLIEWREPVLRLSFSAGKKRVEKSRGGESLGLGFDPLTMTAYGGEDFVTVEAPGRAVQFEAPVGWHRINLDGVEPDRANTNDAMERVRFSLTNPTDYERVARLMFEKTAGGIRHRLGSPITGVSAVLRDLEGNPTGIPVQLSKNWHRNPRAGEYEGMWFHGLTQVRLEPGEKREFELVIVYGHWGGVAAASHAQLSLIGWGGNQLWDESALGSWGESICYEPEQIQANCMITDVRPLMVTPKSGTGKWSWTNNVGGGDFFRLFDLDGVRVGHSSMRAVYHKQGPCLTEVTYAGNVGSEMNHSVTASISRTDDIVRGTYQIRLDVKKAVEFSRLVFFQVGADTYNFTNEARIASGDEAGVKSEWATGNAAAAMRLAGRVPWISMHEGAPRESERTAGAWANRGIVVRAWRAKLGGKNVDPWIRENGHGKSTTIDLVPPPGVRGFEPGDFVEATVEYIVMPKSAGDYYGPSSSLRKALSKDGNTWRMIHREAVGNDRKVKVLVGRILRSHPDVLIAVDDGAAKLEIGSGVGYVPVTFTGLKSPIGYEVKVDGVLLNQAVHGKDFWQVDYDSELRCWSWTCNVPMSLGELRKIQFSRITKP